MKILGIESSGQNAGAAIIKDSLLIAEYTMCHNKTHSVMLLPMIDDLLKKLDTDINDVDGIAISEGPGSFTGLRIGGTMAKAFSFAAEKPLIGVSTLEALAYNVYDYPDLIVPVIDARRQQVYTAVYKKSLSEAEPFEVIKEPLACDIRDILSFVRESSSKTLFVGDATENMRDIISGELGDFAAFASPVNNRQRAASVAALGEIMLRSGKITDTDSFTPVYLRSSQAERVKNES